MMSDKMIPIPFPKLVNWMLEEYKRSHTIFGVSDVKFFQKKNDNQIGLFGETMDTPVGPAAGPHTQLAQNIIASYLSGSRFFELKSVQIMDELEIPKPCILAEDECYNTEWSTELPIMGAFDEYVKAWFALHILQKELFGQNDRRFMFNMSVGYDLKGIQSPKVDEFIEGLKDASNTEVFKKCKASLLESLNQFKSVDQAFVEGISPTICTSITLSTMHGCPPAEIEAIIKYLISEKKLHTFVKMNPTLLGYEYVRNTFDKMGYKYIQLKEESFTHDLQFNDGVEMLKRLKVFAKENQKDFGVKMSNTLPVKIGRSELPGEEMYMSGRALYPLTINLAYKLASEFDGDLNISYSGGADAFNIDRIFETGIQPITVATTLLKPGAYLRFKQMADILDPLMGKKASGKLDMEKLKALAESAFADANHIKEKGDLINRKTELKLPVLDCFIAPCTVGCPIEQDVPEYLRLVGEGRYEEAFDVIVSKNPFPFITGTICTHNCMTKCTRLDYDESVHIRGQKLVAAEKGYDAYMQKLPTLKPESSAKVAVIGAGPSGLAAAYFLAKGGLEVTVFDKRAKAGGTVEYVIPDFRISREAIDKDIKLIERMGVKFEFGIDPNFSVADYKAKGFQYVYLAIGAGKTNNLDIEGDQDRVMGAIPFLEAFNADKDALKLGKNVAVVGGGNSAMDAARAALRVKGVENVYIVYRRTKDYMPADHEELIYAEEDGVIFKELLAPVSLSGGIFKCQKMELGQADTSGRRKPVAIAGSYEELPVDTVLSAIGELIDYDLLKQNGIAIGEKGQISVNEDTLETNVENVYLGGDALVGPWTVVGAAKHGTVAAKAILEKEQRVFKQEYVNQISFDNEKQLLEIAEKKGVMKPVADHKLESERCLECNKVCNICAEVCPNRANLMIPVNGKGLTNMNQILHVDGMCNVCGNCGTFCPYSSEPYKVKLTLFWTEKDFMDSPNVGFYFLDDGSNGEFMLRFDEQIAKVKFDQSGNTDVKIDEKIAAFIWTIYKDYEHLYKVLN
ncbi:putative selenate reductase subunit YgfK [Desulfosporosinus meridiei]|uniref:Putative selenate reductase, YgfK subunit n=1 Tax=Desulfosporosinus meridiei (strain ATCC BAA-275 / DSM 13257 / KCTC 12902 / NCIMB 13706 / S10) TaxID=768704 RepID=J7IW24_DESMD|nr:putative selenate reductase subunit YgfK [Desulfosporosinus meridiei]AFQ43298.1 putative selenate reductase, YgfK subunit [Desulfosporosinus meridiei DSM 13257]